MKSLTDGRSTRWTEHRDRRRRELLRAVRLVIDSHGDDLSMEQISELSGTTKAVLYRYFTDRAGLQTAMGEWAMGIIAKSLDEADAADTANAADASGRSTPEESLRAMVSAFVTLAAGSPFVYRFCDTAVTRFSPAANGGFFNSIAGLLASRLQLSGPEDEIWAAGAIGFVRAATETWLAEAGDPTEFASLISGWLWASRPTD